jgi:hypothetical protein
MTTGGVQQDHMAQRFRLPMRTLSINTNNRLSILDFFHPAYYCTRFFVEKPPRTVPHSGVILSAFATTGEVWPPEKNRLADARLEFELRRIDHQFLIRMIGYCPTDGHAEASWLADLDGSMACQIGMRFHQDALYLIDQGELYVVRCSDPTQRSYVASFAQRLDWIEPEAMCQRLECH